MPGTIERAAQRPRPTGYLNRRAGLTQWSVGGKNQLTNSTSRRAAGSVTRSCHHPRGDHRDRLLGHVAPCTSASCAPILSVVNPLSDNEVTMSSTSDSRRSPLPERSCCSRNGRLCRLRLRNSHQLGQFRQQPAVVSQTTALRLAGCPALSGAHPRHRLSRVGFSLTITQISQGGASPFRDTPFCTVAV